MLLEMWIAECSELSALGAHVASANIPTREYGCQAQDSCYASGQQGERAWSSDEEDGCES